MMVWTAYPKVLSWQSWQMPLIVYSFLDSSSLKSFSSTDTLQKAHLRLLMVPLRSMSNIELIRASISGAFSVGSKLISQNNTKPDTINDSETNLGRMGGRNQ